MIKPFLRDVIDELYCWVVSLVRSFAGSVTRIYSGDVGYYVMYIVLFLAALIFVQMRWRVW
jgi:hypothetical protein